MNFTHYLQQHQQQQNTSTLLQAHTAANSFTSTKRKLEDEHEAISEQARKRLHYLSTKNTQLMGEEMEEKKQLLEQLTHTTMDASAQEYKPSATAMADFGNQSIASTFGITTPPAEGVEQEESVYDSMMLDDEYTDEDESLQTPSYVNNYSYIPADIGVDLDDGGFTGELERGWSEMFNEMY